MRRFDASEIASMLNERISELAPQLAPNGRREGHEWVALNPTRYDKNPGSFRICISGSKQGLWSEFSDIDARGDALDLIAYCLFGRDKKQAFKWAKEWLGLSQAEYKNTSSMHRTRNQSEPTYTKEALPEDDNKKGKMGVAAWLNSRKKIRGTPADWYLKGRGIDIELLDKEPGALRFNPELYNAETKQKIPAMIAVIVDSKGKSIAVHRTYLKVTAKYRAEKAPLKNPKMTLGNYAGGTINLRRGSGGKPLKDAPEGDSVIITEGIEDALTIAIACPDRRVLCAVSLSNMGRVELPKNIKTVTICADNDAPDSPADRALKKAIRRFQEEGRKVLIARAPKGHKDFNDVVMKGAA